MSNIHAIVTHHRRPDEAAEAWKREGVCAVGWSWYGPLRRNRSKYLRDNPSFAKERQLFLSIRKGDVVLAYSKRKTIAYVGTVVNRFTGPRNDNEIGREDGFGYKNQIKVEWWPEPHHFDRSQLPVWLAGQLGKRGKTVIRLDLGKDGFDRTVGMIKQYVRSRSALDEFEDLAKAGLRKYMNRRIDKIEAGLKILKAESFTSDIDRPDFTAVDRNGRIVLIECKGKGYGGDCEQIESYGKHYRAEKKPRLVLLAFDFDPRCKKVARSKGIELVECDLNFEKVS